MWLAVLGFIGLVYSLNESVPTGRYEYKVTIDDTVSFTELYEKYDVIDQDGKIWTIREKEQ